MSIFCHNILLLQIVFTIENYSKHEGNWEMLTW